MTKLLRAPILLDEPTAKVVRDHIPRELARCRRLAVVKPYGLDTAVVVSELLPPESDYPLLTDQNVADYEAALDALLDGRWQRAFELLHRVPAEDRAKDFLTVFIAQHNRTPPPNWDGVIPLATKG
jgi:adenylate cyclase